MTKSVTDSELSDDLLTLRGVQWIMGTKDDPYALLLRAASDDPHELGRRIRERGALYWSHAGVWVTADHELGRAVLLDPRLSPRPPQDAEEETGEEAEPMPWDFPTLRKVLPLHDAFVNMDRADYDRLAPVRLQEPEITRLHEESVRRLDGEFDLLTGYALETAARGAALLLGLPPDRHEHFADLCARSAGLLDATMCPPQLGTARTLATAVSEIRDLFTGDALPVGVLTAAVGVEITANLVCNALAVLLDHPEQWKTLCADPGLAPAAIEETLRYAPPVRLRNLFAQEDVELAGQRVEAGQEVVIAVEAANRDPRAHAAPDRFDLGRRPAPVLFEGPQIDLVAPMARLQATAALRALATELPEIRRTGPVLRRLRSPVTGGVLEFPVSTAGGA
ncbi:P450-derived glycosyltransferase activator [Streptosporangium sp. LJ11]|uniref:cytochrome P450 family protein n=1 Tax=Streptosporangium sp. LJ11 TaxID=3436927 RepID=UPI003F7A537C